MAKVCWNESLKIFKPIILINRGFGKNVSIIKKTYPKIINLQDVFLDLITFFK